MNDDFFSFTKLAAYQRAMDLVEKVYKTLKQFPSEERYALCDQLRRAVTAIPSNMAEGLTRYSNKEKVHFLEISYSSMMEVYCQMSIAQRLGYISQETMQGLEDDITNIARPLSGLRASLLAKV